MNQNDKCHYHPLSEQKDIIILALVDEEVDDSINSCNDRQHLVQRAIGEYTQAFGQIDNFIQFHIHLEISIILTPVFLPLDRYRLTAVPVPFDIL